ncbi:phytanoyl-CoA dioxygenase [Aureococcus anophagefferens]|nr:phytanoyl-CoA dioxygenase [Aureococcus anophagefferens]
MFKLLPGLTDVGAPPHPSDLYDYGAIAEDQGALPATPEELAHAKATFDRDGLVVFSRGLEASAPALRAAVDALKDGSNADFRDALLAQRRARGGAPPDFTNGAKIPWVQYEAGCEAGAGDRMRKAMGFAKYSRPIRERAVEDPRLNSLVRALLGDADFELYQDMALLKPPGGGREKPWHQDAAYFNLAADARVVGCWIALDAATPDNGCLVFERGGHARGELPHFPVRDYQLCDAEPRRDVVACPLPPGGLVLFHGRVPTARRARSGRGTRQLHWVASATAASCPRTRPAAASRASAARPGARLQVPSFYVDALRQTRTSPSSARVTSRSSSA